MVAMPMGPVACRTGVTTGTMTSARCLLQWYLQLSERYYCRLHHSDLEQGTQTLMLTCRHSTCLHGNASGAQHTLLLLHIAELIECTCTVQLSQELCKGVDSQQSTANSSKDQPFLSKDTSIPQVAASSQLLLMNSMKLKHHFLHRSRLGEEQLCS